VDTSEAICEDVVGNIVVKAESEGCRGTKVLWQRGAKPSRGQRIVRGHTSLRDRYGCIDMKVVGDIE